MLGSLVVVAAQRYNEVMLHKGLPSRAGLLVPVGQGCVRCGRHSRGMTETLNGWCEDRDMGCALVPRALTIAAVASVFAQDGYWVPTWSCVCAPCERAVTTIDACLGVRLLVALGFGR